MDTHESYVSLETAKLLKQVGFDWEVTSYYQNNVFYHYVVNNRCRLVIMNQNSASDYMDQYSAPTLSVAQKWLREVKDKQVHVISYRDQKDRKITRLGVTKCMKCLKDGNLIILFMKKHLKQELRNA